jgi:hypothetical protein
MLNEFAATFLQAADLTRARDASGESLAILRKLAAAAPSNATGQRDVSVGLNTVGDVRRAEGDCAEALSAYEESLAIVRKLAAVPAMPSGSVALARASKRLATRGSPRATGQGHFRHTRKVWRSGASSRLPIPATPAISAT